jgi:hypothetical protein
MQAGCHASCVINRLNSVADEPFASIDLQLWAYTLEQSGTTARPDGPAMAADDRRFVAGDELGMGPGEVAERPKARLLAHGGHGW